MSRNTGKSSRHNPNGKHQLYCGFCGCGFRNDNPTIKYCCYSHKAAVGNRIHYRLNRKTVIMRVIINRAKKSGGATIQRKTKAPDVSQMDNDQLLEYLRNNPGMISRRK